MARSTRCGEPGGDRPQKCQWRIEAEREGRLVWNPGLRAYILTDAPLRAVSQRAAYYAEERGVDVRPGLPYTWTCCPACGGDLVSADATSAQADGLGAGDGPE